MVDPLLCQMNTDHIGIVAKLHLLCFPDFFLTFLGKGFLKQYYRGLILSNNTIAILSLDEMGEARGFVTGVVNPSSFYRRLLRKYWYRFILSSMPAVIKKPTIIPRLLRATRKPVVSRSGEGIAELTSICVNPAFENEGLGKQLVYAFIDEARKYKCVEVVLYTDAQGNDKINKFYSELGFRIIRLYVTPEGRSMNEYSREIC